MPSLFDGPKSVLNDITNVMKQSHEKKVNGFVDEAIAKGKNTPQQVADYANRVKGPGFAREAAKVAQEKLK
jgi:hypothetical protein